MSKFRINKEDYTEHLEGFSFKCPKCHGDKTQLLVIAALLPLHAGCRGVSVHIMCDECSYVEEIWELRG